MLSDIWHEVKGALYIKCDTIRSTQGHYEWRRANPKQATYCLYPRVEMLEKATLLRESSTMSKDWKSITKDELKELTAEYTNRMIGEMYGVSVGQVKYKRKKFNISAYDLAFQKALDQIELSAFPQEYLLLDRGNINFLSKAITQYAFRSGPIEQIHVDGKLTDEDMKILNKYMVNRMAGLLLAAFDEKWDQIAKIFEYYAGLSSGWDDAVPDTRDFDIGF